MGLFGSGKSAAMVMEAYRARRRDPEIRVMHNLSRLDLPGAPTESLAEARSLEDMLEMLAEFKGGYLLIDEAGVYLPARVWSRMPAELSWKWQQLRKDQVELRWTCIRPNNVVKDLRDITFETHWCESYKKLGFMRQRHYGYTAVNDPKYLRATTFHRFRPKLWGQLYDTLGKVEAAAFVPRSKVSAGD